MKKKGIVLLGVFAVLCAIIFICKLWPLFEMKDPEGNVIGEHRGILHMIGPIVDPYYFPGTYFTVDVDREKLPDTISPEEALKIAFTNLRNRGDAIDGPIFRIINGKQILICLTYAKAPGMITDESINGKASKLEFRRVKEDINANELTDKNGKIEYSKIPKSVDVLKDRAGYLVALEKQPVLSGGDIRDAKIQAGQNGIYGVWIKFTENGGRLFAGFTEKNIGKKYAIILDDIVYMSRVIESKFSGLEGLITSGLSREEASDLVLVFQAGHEIPVKIVDVKVKNPNNTWGVIDGGPINKK